MVVRFKILIFILYEKFLKYNIFIKIKSSAFN
jgi:hypothetical protein